MHEIYLYNIQIPGRPGDWLAAPVPSRGSPDGRVRDERLAARPHPARPPTLNTGAGPGHRAHQELPLLRLPGGGALWHRVPRGEDFGRDHKVVEELRGQRAPQVSAWHIFVRFSEVPTVIFLSIPQYSGAERPHRPVGGPDRPPSRRRLLFTR